MVPTKQTVKATREALGLTQEEAGAMVYTSRRSWQDWEGGQRSVHPGLWELFLIKTKTARKKAGV
ncbi:MAG: helix-turn-helix transcriptional regulator [Pseudomonadota bacterium]